eukprot:GHVR01105513.1.p1 GENE.GHVR01105513.1~~GHVR01105513.1.p1  ORF type:complete len:150 (-),score=8.04 GHVR01105513.1:281-730(-)
MDVEIEVEEAEVANKGPMIRNSQTREVGPIEAAQTGTRPTSPTRKDHRQVRQFIMLSHKGAKVGRCRLLQQHVKPATTSLGQVVMYSVIRVTQVSTHEAEELQAEVCKDVPFFKNASRNDIKNNVYIPPNRPFKLEFVGKPPRSHSLYV